MIEICPSHIYRREPEEIPEFDAPQGGAKWGYCYNHWCVNRSSGEIRRGRTLECDKWRLPTQDDFIELFDYVGNPDVSYKSNVEPLILNESNDERLIPKATNLMINDSAGKKLKSSESYGFSSPSTIGGWRNFTENPDAFGTNEFGFGVYPAQTRDRKGKWQNEVDEIDGESIDRGYGRFGMLWSKESYVKYPLEHWIGNTYNGDVLTIGIPVGALIGWGMYYLPLNLTPIGWLINLGIVLAALVWLVGIYFYEYSVGGAVFFRYETERVSVNVKEGSVPAVFDSTKHMFGYTFERAGGGASIRLIRRDMSGWVDGEKYTDGAGRQYNTVKIGNQVWLASNLRTYKWKSGKNIVRRDGDVAWFSRGESRLATYSAHSKYSEI